MDGGQYSPEQEARAGRSLNLQSGNPESIVAAPSSQIPDYPIPDYQIPTGYLCSSINHIQNMKTTTVWKGGSAYESKQPNGAQIAINATAGFSPKALLLSGLAGCSGIDVVDILEKMRVPFASLEIEAEAEQTDTHPRVFTGIHVTYKVGTEPENREKVIKAIELSLEKYCGVAAMLRKNSDIRYTLQLIKPGA
ncbi:MAG: OsmC family peroxiredoxin [Chitinophagaceae bacterium]|nr:MAG: OsmC family peroxiredoxin [Chitinophagaceae bacterium]